MLSYLVDPDKTGTMSAKTTKIKEPLDEVSANKIWREHCESEAQLQSFNEKFAITNIRKTCVLPEKPTAQRPFSRMVDEEEVSQALALLDSLCNSNVLKLHQDVHTEDCLPATSNRAYGAFPQALSELHRMFDYRMQHTAVTAFPIAPGKQAKVVDSSGKPVKVEHPWQ